MHRSCSYCQKIWHFVVVFLYCFIAHFTVYKQWCTGSVWYTKINTGILAHSLLQTHWHSNGDR